MWVCPASPMSMRRYEYIEYENGKLLGEKKYCSLGTTKVNMAKVLKCFWIKNIFLKISRLTHGGDIFSGTAVTASAFVMSRAKNLTDIST